MINLDHDDNYRQLYRQLLDACDKRLQALYDADYQGAEIGYDSDLGYTPSFLDDLDEIDDDVKETANWLIDHNWWGDVSDLLNSCIQDAAEAINADSGQLAAVADIRSVEIDGYNLPMIVITAQPSADDTTEYVIDCEPDVNGGNGIMHLDGGKVSSSDCLDAISDSARYRLRDLARRITEEHYELSLDEEDGLCGDDYRVAICATSWRCDCGTVRVLPLDVVDKW